MNEQETREKTIKALERAALSVHEYVKEQIKNAFQNGAKHYSNKDGDKSIYDFWADALIAANMGDISAWKQRAEVAEAENATLREKLRKAMSCPRRFDVVFRGGDDD